MGAWSDGLEQHCLEPVLYVIYTYNLSEGAIRLIGFILADARLFVKKIQRKFRFFLFLKICTLNGISIGLYPPMQLQGSIPFHRHPYIHIYLCHVTSDICHFR